jgi:hypothetical protein
LKVLLRTSSAASSTTDTTNTSSSGGTITPPSVSSSVVNQGINSSELSPSQKAVLDAAKALVGTSASRTIYRNCWEGAYQVYRNAKVGDVLAYSDLPEKSYTITNEKGYEGHPKPATIITELNRGSSYTYNNGKTFPTFGVRANAVNKGLNMDAKLSGIQPGDLLSYVWRDDAGHSAIFIRWEDKENRIAYLFDWNGNSNGKPVFRYYPEDLSDSTHPVYEYWNPSTTGKATVEVIITNLPKDSQSDFFTLSSSANTAGEKITAHAQKYFNASSTISSTELVINSLKAAGVTISASTLSDLHSKLKESSSFYEVDITKTQKTGDIIFLGKGCQVPYSVGILSETSEPSKYMNVYTNVGKKVTLQSPAVSSSILSGTYAYKAYRYIGDLSNAEKSQIQKANGNWTITNALNNIENNKLKGSYTENENFMSQIVFENLLTEKECDTLKGTGLFALQKDIIWLKQLLLSKKAPVSGGAH